MSARAIFIAIGVLVALGALAWLVAPGGGGAAERPAPILDFAPSDVRAFVIDRPGAGVERVSRGSFGWTYSVKTPGRPAATWPIDAAQPRALLSVLGALAPVADAQQSAMPEGALTLRLLLADGGERTLDLAPTSVGGRRLARANGGAVVTIDKPIFEALTSPGPRAWRETRVFRSVGAETSRISIEHSNSTIVLARVLGRWSMRSPARAPADDDAVARLLDDLANLRIDEWSDRGSTADAASGEPFLRIRLERDRVTADADGDRAVETDAESFAVFGPADLAGAQRVAIVGEPGAAAVVDALTLGRVAPLAESLVSRAAVDSHASRISRIHIERDGSAVRTLRRTLDGWRDDETGGVAEDAANQLLTLLTVEVCDDVSFAADSRAPAIAHVRLIGFDDGELAAASIARDGDDLIITTGDVHRRYERTPAPIALAR